MTRRVWQVARLAGGAAVLAVVAWRVGTGPFVDGLRSVDLTALAAAVCIGVVTTACAAWRWMAIARGFGTEMPFQQGLAACYRAQFLNTALPFGVLGDVHRGLRHGIRAVVWDRVAGQVVQVVLALAALTVVPWPGRWVMPAVLAGCGAVVLVVMVLRRSISPVRDELHRAFATSLPVVVSTSTLAVVGHVATFVIAARAAGVDASTARLVPLALLVLLAMAVPLNIGGWGPREGVAAWAFAAAGLTAGAGVATATVFGVLVIAACLPGAIVLLTPARPVSAPTHKEVQHA